MKKNLLQACMVMLVLVGIQMSSCRKTANEQKTKTDNQKEAALQKMRSEFSTKPVTLFSKRITLTDAMVKTMLGKSTETGKGPCNFTFTGSYLMYNIQSSLCPTNDYIFNFTFYLYVNGSSALFLANDNVHFNSYLLSNPTHYTYSFGVPPTGGNPSGNGVTFTGSVTFSAASISCGMSTANLNFTGDCNSYLCSPGNSYNISIPVTLRPSACSGEAPVPEIYPNTGGSAGEIDIFYPWDLSCYSPCYLPNDWYNIHLEFYKSPGGTHNYDFTGATPFSTGPYTVIVTDGAGTYFVRARWSCLFGSSDWSGWKPVAVN